MEAQNGLVPFELEVKDRLVIPEFFPERGSLIIKTLERDIANKCMFSQAEMAQYGIIQKAESGQVVWDPAKAKPKTVGFTEAEIRFLKDQVDRMDREQAFTAQTAETALKIKKL